MGISLSTEGPEARYGMHLALRMSDVHGTTGVSENEVLQ
jgi:hypothetical protein